jgi:hypothetical protein
MLHVLKNETMEQRHRRFSRRISSAVGIMRPITGIQ